MNTTLHPARRSPVALLLLFVWATVTVSRPATAAPDTTASYAIEIGAEVEILPRDPDLTLVVPDRATSTIPPEPAPGVVFAANADAGAQPVIHTLLAGASISGSASWAGGPDSANASGYAAGAAYVRLVNFSEEPKVVVLEVDIPGRTPDLRSTNGYTYRAEVGDNLCEVARTMQKVEILGPTQIPELPITVLLAESDTRDAGLDEGPQVRNAHGLPYGDTFHITVPPSLEATSTSMGTEILIREYRIGLFARVAGVAISAECGRSEALTFEPSFPFDMDEPPPPGPSAPRLRRPVLWGLLALILLVLVAAVLVTGRLRRA